MRTGLVSRLLCFPRPANLQRQNCDHASVRLSHLAAAGLAVALVTAVPDPTVAFGTGEQPIQPPPIRTAENKAVRDGLVGSPAHFDSQDKARL